LEEKGGGLISIPFYCGDCSSNITCLFVHIPFPQDATVFPNLELFLQKKVRAVQLTSRLKKLIPSLPHEILTIQKLGKKIEKLDVDIRIFKKIFLLIRRELIIFFWNKLFCKSSRIIVYNVFP
jgi:hypothetical protein